MNIIGTVFIDEFAIVRNGTHATVTLTNVPVASLFQIGMEPACGHVEPKPIIPNTSQFIAIISNVKNPDKPKDIRVITVEKVYEYQIIDDSVTLKFSFIDKDQVGVDNPIEIKPVITDIVRYGTVLALVFKGGYGDMPNSDAKELIQSYCPSITHLGVYYIFNNAHQYLLSRVDLSTTGDETADIISSKTGIIATYTTITPASERDISCALELLKGALRVRV